MKQLLSDIEKAAVSSDPQERNRRARPSHLQGLPDKPSHRACPGGAGLGTAVPNGDWGPAQVEPFVFSVVPRAGVTVAACSYSFT